MLIEYCEIEKVFRKVKAVRQEMRAYEIEGRYIELNPSRLRDTIGRMYNLNIEMYEVFASGEFVAGNVERYRDGRAVIMVKSQQSEAMVRFVAVKELCHLMIDEEDDWSASAIDTINQMKAEFDLVKANGEGVQNPSRTQQSEYLAMIGATALMYPCEFHAADREKKARDEISFAKIGLVHNIPAWAVESAFNHADIFDTYISEIGGD